MSTHTLYFTNGRDVEITDSTFQVKNISYPLKGIFGHKVSTVLPHRGPFTVLTVIGALVFLCGAFNFLPSEVSGSVSFFGIIIVANAIVMVLGIMVMLLGMFAIFHLRDKYLVKLVTSNGEKTALISNKREYVNQITDALNHAQLDLMKRSSDKA